MPSVLSSLARGQAMASAASPAATAMQQRLVAHLTAAATSAAPALEAAVLGSSSTSLLPRLLAFLRRLAAGLLSFALHRLRRSPMVVRLWSKLHALRHWYESSAFSAPDSFVARCLAHFSHAARLAVQAVLDTAAFAQWVLDPKLYIRRLYRFSVGLFVLLVVHSVCAYVGERLQYFIYWLYVERGIWRGDAKCIRKRELDHAMRNATNYQEWRSAAQQLDELENERIVWKHSKPSGQYQWKRIAKNVECIRNLIATHQTQQTKRQSQLETTAAAPASASSTSAASFATAAAPSAAAPAASSTSTTLPSPQPFSLTASTSQDPHALMRYLRSRLFRDIGGVLNAKLYFDPSDHFSSTFPDPTPPAVGLTAKAPEVQSTTCRIGTKQLIEDYHGEVIHGLETVLNDSSIPAPAKLAFFRETRHAYGRSALLLNGGANLGMLHLGVVKALLEMDALPQIISGSSVGAIFAALICSRTDEELARIGDADFLQLQFPSGQGSLRRKLRRFLEEGILMDISTLIHCVRSHMGDITFEQAYQRYGRICNVLVTPVHMNRKRKRSAGEPADDDSELQSSEPILLNYLTAPSVLIWSAACASCAVPHLYAPVELLAKNPAGDIIPYFAADNDEPMRFGAGCVDGSVVKMDVAMDRLRTLFNCNNFIVSQLNLCMTPFIFHGQSFSAANPVQKLLRYLAREIYQRVTNLFNLLGLNASTLGRRSAVQFLLYIHSLTSQAIKGDITLVPPVSWRDYGQLLQNPSTRRLNRCVDVARRYTWTRGSLIKAHCVVEFALDRCVRKVRNQMGLSEVPSSSSAAFAHPNRSYSVSNNSVASPFVQQQQPILRSSAGSPSHTPAPPTTSFWSKKLNARALQPPPRKSSFSADAPSMGMLPPGNLPVLDLALGRNSPLVLHRTHESHALHVFASPPAQANSSLAFPAVPLHASPASTTAAAHAHRHRAHTSLSSSPTPEKIARANTAGTANGDAPSTRAPLMIVATTAALQPPPMTSQLSSGASQLPSSSSPQSGDAGDPSIAGGDESDSDSSTAPGTPAPADSSRDDLQEAASASRSSLTPSVSQPQSQASSKASSQIRVRHSPRPALISPTPSLLIAVTESNLLRAVPSLSGASRSPVILPAASPSSSALPASLSGARLDDGFNRDVMAQLNQQQLMFSMPRRPKNKKSAAKSHAAGGASDPRAVVGASTTSGSDDPSSSEVEAEHSTAAVPRASTSPA